MNKMIHKSNDTQIKIQSFYSLRSYKLTLKFFLFFNQFYIEFTYSAIKNKDICNLHKY